MSYDRLCKLTNEQIRAWQIARRGTFTKSEREALERVCAERGIR